MKINKLAIVLLIGIGGITRINAQTEMTGPDLTGEMPSETGQTLPGTAEEKVADWYVNMDFSGFEFELPAGLIVDKGTTFVAKHPDGSFGLSMANEKKRGANQNTAYDVCRMLAKELRLPQPVVEKVKYGKCSGARATGKLEGRDITILVLPYDNNQVTTVLLATPDRQAWTAHFLETLKR